jgi:hypothetical protein
VATNDDDDDDDKKDPFSDWTDLIHKPVYSVDQKKLGFLRKTPSGYMVVGRGLVNLTKYFIPKSLAESVSKKGIKLKITAYEARSKYSYAKMKNFLPAYGLISRYNVEHRIFYDRFQTLKHGTTRNRLAAGVAFVSGILLLISGYKATLTVYSLVQQEIMIHTSTQFWMFILVPVGILSILSQLGGVTVLMGAALFAAKRVNIGKFLLSVGTGQGLFTIAFHIASEISSGRLLAVGNNYIVWLTSSVAGLGILFAVIAQSISKGKGDSFVSRAVSFVLRKNKEKTKEY